MNRGSVEIAPGRPSRGVRWGAAALLDPTGQTVEETTQDRGPGSAIEREILALLRLPARRPPGIRDLKHELLSYSALRVQTAILNLLDKGLIEMVCENGYELVFKLAKNKR